MVLNIADLFEHAADAFGDRTAVACGDSQVTYGELEERVNRLAHHLAGIGVGPGDHVGLYARNSIEATETLIAACKLRAAAVNINYRYVESELRYMLADSDPAALVYDRQFAPRVAAAAEAAPGLRGTVVIDDGSDTRIHAGADAGIPGTDYAAALAAASPERDFTPRSSDDIYIIYTGGTTGFPKGVMWRHEDIWRTLGGGIDFATGVPLPDEWEQTRRGRETGGLVKLCAAPLIHGNAQVAALAGLFSGDTIVLLPRFDAHEIWRAVERRKVNLLVIIGDAMARPLIEAHLRRQIAGYKMPRSIWLVDAIGRAPSGKPDYSWARRYAANRPASAEHPDAERPAPERPAPEFPAPERPANAASSAAGGHPAA